MITPEKFLKLIKNDEQNIYKYGVINSVNGNKATILFDGETTPSIKEYLAVSYSPNVSDRVLLLATQGTYLILGAIGGAGGGGDISNLDGGKPNTNYGGMDAIVGGGV